MVRSLGCRRGVGDTHLTDLFPVLLGSGSCKGLALPFLVNWLLGDFTNLIGCVFTDQLPFQVGFLGF